MFRVVHWDNLRKVPADALKEITFGKLKGKKDINPQWRYEAMTKEFGPCGIGWKYDIANTWTVPVEKEVMLFVQINLSIKKDDAWSEPIPAIGGDFLLIVDKNGLHGNDEAYKMATTDALGAAMKMLGVAADVYRGHADDSKYGREPLPNTQQPKPAQQNNQQTQQSQSSLKWDTFNNNVKNFGLEDQILEIASKYYNKPVNTLNEVITNQQELNKFTGYLAKYKKTA